MLKITQIPCNNYNIDSGPKTDIVIHGTAGGSTAVGIANFFKNTEGGTNPVAAHYIVGTDGDIVQCVQEKDGAWSNGSTEWNNKAVSIEHVKSALDNSSEITSAQKSASFELIGDICKRNNIGSLNIWPHSAVFNTACPGPYPWDDLRKYLATPVVHVASLAQRAQATYEWTAFWIGLKMPSPPTGSAIFESWLSFKIKGRNFGPPITWEYHTVDWNNKSIIQQDFAHASCEYNNGVSRWFDSGGEIQ